MKALDTVDTLTAGVRVGVQQGGGGNHSHRAALRGSPGAAARAPVVAVFADQTVSLLFMAADYWKKNSFLSLKTVVCCVSFTPHAAGYPDVNQLVCVPGASARLAPWVAQEPEEMGLTHPPQPPASPALGVCPVRGVGRSRGQLGWAEVRRLSGGPGRDPCSLDT